MNRKAKIRVKNRGSHYCGEVEMPLRGGGRIIASTLGWDPTSALKRAATAAVRISSDPAIAPFVPAPVKLAAKVARKVTQMDEPQMTATAKTGTGTERKIASSLVKSTRAPGSFFGMTVQQPRAATPAQQPVVVPQSQAPQYDPYSQFTDPAAQMAMQAWGESNFADGSFARDEEDSPVDDDGEPMDEAWDGMYDSEELEPEDYDIEGEEA